VRPQDISYNRKFIEGGGAREMKKMSRRGKMLTVSKYLSDIRGSGGSLVSETQEFKDAFRECDEMVVRARTGISAKQLTDFITKKISPVLDQAAVRFERVSMALPEMKTEMLGFWTDVEDTLRVINSEVKSECYAIKEEALVIGMELLKQIEESERLGMHRGTGIVDVILGLVCVIEFCCFVAFFVRYRHQNRKLLKKE
jgi:hypothetical protein